MMNIKDLWSPYAGDLTAPEGQAVGIPCGTVRVPLMLFFPPFSLDRVGYK